MRQCNQPLQPIKVIACRRKLGDYSGRARRTPPRADSGSPVLVLPIRSGSRIGQIPVATLARALASAIVFLFVTPHDRVALGAASDFYVGSGLAATELPRYRAYLAQSSDPDAPGRMARLERAAGPSERPADPVATIELLRADRAFDRQLHADLVVAPTDPGYAEWKRNRGRFDQLAHATLGERLELSARSWREPWRFVTYLLLHPTVPAWLANLLVLLLVGPFAEAVAGPALLLLCYAGGGAFSGAVNLLLSPVPAMGDWGALAALAGLLATFGRRPIASRLTGIRLRFPVPAIAAVVVVAGVEALRWALVSHGAIDLTADLSGIAFGAAMAVALKLADSARVRGLASAAADEDDDEAAPESGLAREAREAATRLETRRATQLYKELVDLEPRRTQHLCGYLNVALMGPDETILQDAALRLLWLRTKSHSDTLRKAFLQLTQPKVLKVLPIDEHLRLARRLVRLREDAAALKVLDAILADNHLRQLYGRQLADCLLGIYTGYMRRRLTTLAETIRSRLTTYFEGTGHIGGMPPATRPPTTLVTTSFRGSDSRFR